MEFTVYFLRVYYTALVHASPLLAFLILWIALIGYRIGRIEGWSVSDGLYHAFVNATTVGYGDLHPTKKQSKALAILLAFVGLIFTGILVAIAVHAAGTAYGQLHGNSGF